jgi:hypothetical protein
MWKIVARNQTPTIMVTLSISAPPRLNPGYAPGPKSNLFNFNQIYLEKHQYLWYQWVYCYRNISHDKSNDTYFIP